MKRGSPDGCPFLADNSPETIQFASSLIFEQLVFQTDRITPEILPTPLRPQLVLVDCRHTADIPGAGNRRL